MQSIATVWEPSFFRLNAAQRIERVTGSLRKDGHRILTVSSGLWLDGVKAAGIVTDSGLCCFPIGRFSRSRNIIQVEYAKYSIAPLRPQSSFEQSISLHDLAVMLHLPSKYYLSRLDYELTWPTSPNNLWLQICRHEAAIYPEDVRGFLPGVRHELMARDAREIKAFSDVLIDALALFAKSTRPPSGNDPDAR